MKELRARRKNNSFWELNYLWYLKFFEGSAIRAPFFFGNLQLIIWVKTIVTPPVNGRFTADFLHTSPAASNTLPWTTQMCSWGPSHVGGAIQVCWSTPEAVLQREGSKTSLPEGLRAGCSGLPSGRPPGGSHTHPCLHGSVALNPNGGFARCTWAALLSRPCWHSLRRGKSTACAVPPA